MAQAVLIRAGMTFRIERGVLALSKPLSILLAEDEPEFRELLAHGLEADGAVVESVEDGEQALRKLLSESARPDVLISDVRMPKQTGADVLRAVRAAGLGLPVILLTGFGHAVDRAEIDGLGGAVLLEKPFDFDDLRTALRNLPIIARLHSTKEGE